MKTDDLLFDTGILKNVLRTTENDNFLNETLDALGFSGRAPYVTTSPLLLLEVLGISGGESYDFFPGSPNEQGVKQILKGSPASEIEERFTIAFHFIEDCIRKNPKTTFPALQAGFLAERNFPRRSPISRYLLDMLLGENLTEARYASFVSRFAFDIFQGLPFENYELDRAAMTRFDSIFLSTIFLSMREEDGGNFACARYVDKILLRAQGKNVPEPASPYEVGKQMLDTELTHYALVGSRRENKAYTVSILTTENLSGWRERLARYHALIKFLIERESPRHGPVHLFPGYVYSVDRQGKLTGKSIDVRKEQGI
jgi:hypothetical protein